MFDNSQKKSLNTNMSSMISKQDKNSMKMRRKPMFDQTGTILMNGIKLTFERGFGFEQNPNINSTAHSIDDNKVVYILGKQIIQYDMLTQNQKVIDSISQDQQITTFVYFKNFMLDDNIMYSIHAMNKTYPSIICKNYSKSITQKYIMTHLQKQQKIISILLINENKYIVALSELQGTYRLSYIDVHTKQIVITESIYFKVNGMFVPEANHKCIILYNAVQLYIVHLAEQIKPIALGFAKQLGLTHNQKPSEQIIQAISSIIVSNDILVYLITSKGNLHFVNISHINNKIQSISSIFLGDYETLDNEGNIITTNKVPSSICCNQYNIVIGYNLVQEFTLIKICPIAVQKSTLQKIKFKCPNLHKILRMHFAHQTMSICVTVQVKQGDKFDLTMPVQSDYLKQNQQQNQKKQQLSSHLLKEGKVFPVIFNMLLHDTLVQTLRSPIQSILGWMLFVKQIQDIAILPTKKIMLILSKQKKIKAIKYEHLSSTSFQRMLLWQAYFNQNDVPLCLDVHPLTFNTAIGFKQGLKMFTISSQGLKPNNIHFPLKGCETVKYSKFGHKLIAGSSNQIVIISPYENKIIHTIPLNSTYNCRQLNFIDRDMYIFSFFSNGSSMIMNQQGNKLFQVYKKQTKTLCSAYDSVFDITVVSYNQNFTKFYRQRGTQQFGVLWTYPFNVTKILIVNELGTIFMGTSLGKIRAYQWPFTDMVRFNKSFTQIQLHSSPISKLKIVHDLSILISGAEDGSIFISKINAYSDGIAISDSQIAHSLKTVNKNSTNLYYLQNYMITSSGIEFGQQENIVQLQSDKADFQSEYTQILINMERNIQHKIKQQQINKKNQYSQELQSRQSEIQQITEKKNKLRTQLQQLRKKIAFQQQQCEDKKLKKMRQLYAQTDVLTSQKKKLQQLYSKNIKQLKQDLSYEYQTFFKKLKTDEQQLIKQISIIQKQYNQANVNYDQLMKQQEEQGRIYKSRMLSALQKQFQQQKQEGEKLRKAYNKIKHATAKQQQKLKHFQQLITQIQIDIQSKDYRHKDLRVQEDFLSQKLQEKDKIILEQQRSVKQLLAKNINNYTHEQYLKHRQQQLLQKVKYLQEQKQRLDKKYNDFQNDFVQVTNQTNQLNQNIDTSMQNIQKLKNKDKILKQQLYVKKYKNSQLYNKIYQAFKDSNCNKQQFIMRVHQIFMKLTDSIDLSTNNVSQNSNSSSNSLFALIPPKQQTPQEKTQHRDNLIKQVVNTNNLRKIDDTIRRTIMIKLNRQTVSLTCEVNQLRKQKKKLGTKIKQLKYYLDQLLGDEKQNQNNKNNLNQGSNKTKSMFEQTEDIIPVNISIIRAKQSKHVPQTLPTPKQKLLPFQIYHNNKQSKHSHYQHSRNFTKGDFDQSSTQLPSLLPSILKNNSISQQGSGLFNIDEINN